MKICSWLTILALLSYTVVFSQETVYYNNFDDMENPVNQYTGNPEVNDFILFSPWTTTANEFSTIVGEGYQNSPNLSIDGNGTESIFFSIEVEEGFELDITGYEFWVKKTQGNSAWSLIINGVEMADGNTGSLGETVVGNIDNFVNATGTLAFEFEIKGMGNGVYILDEFKLFGETRPICDDELIASHPANQNLCAGDTISLMSMANPNLLAEYQWEFAENGEWQALSDDEIYDGSNTNTLTITNAPYSFNSYSYRCLITVGYCSELTNEATLTVYEIPYTQPIIHN